jgi:ABC-type sugar transport system ATPase subunit
VTARESAGDDRHPLYAVEGITKHFGGVVALTNVDFSVSPGEVVGLVGDNGAGKSTLVGVLSGAHAPDSGHILLDGRRIHWSSPHDALAAGIETLYQESGIAPDLTVAANIFLGREILKKGLLGRLGFLAESEMYQRARKELERVGIAMPGANRTVSRFRAAKGRRSRSAARSPGRRRSFCSTNRPTIWAPVRPPKFSTSSAKPVKAGLPSSSSRTRCRMCWM